MKNKLIRKSNALIEASYKLYASEKRVILFLSSMIMPDDKDFKSYKLSIKEFASISGLKHKGEYAQVREITRRLISRVLEIHTPTGLLQTSWLSSAEYIEGSGEVILKFDSKLKPFLLQLKERFTKYSLEQAIRLKSIYSIRIYELLKQYEKIGERVMLIDDLRHKLGLEDGQYRNYNSFKVYVLTSSQAELAEKTDITFEFEEIKIGRKVGKVRFFIKSRELDAEKFVFAEDLPVQEESNRLEELLEILPEEYRKQQSIKKIIAEYLENHDFDYVARNIEYANANSTAVKSASAGSRNGNYRNYLSKSLKNDFGLAYKEDTEAAKSKEQKEKQQIRDQHLQEKREKDKIEQEITLMGQARQLLANMTPDERLSIEAEAILNLPPDLQKMALEKRMTAQVAINRAMEKVIVERYFKNESSAQNSSENALREE